MHQLNQHKAPADAQILKRSFSGKLKKIRTQLLYGVIEEIKGVKFNDARILC